MNKKKRNKNVLIIVFLYLLLIFIIDYPIMKRLWNEREQKQVIEHYNTVITDTEQQATEGLMEDARRYNQGLTEKEFELGGTFLEDNEIGKGYQNILNPAGDGVMGYLKIPKIEVDLPIYHGTSEEVLQKGVGHLEGTSFPIGEASTHACLTAHRGLPEKKLFTNLDLLKEGDIFYIYVLNDVFAYEVDMIETVTPDNVDPLSICSGEDRVTLVTCTPYGINSHRLYVHGKRIPVETESEIPEEVSQEVSRDWESFLVMNWWLILTMILLVWLFIMLFILRSREKAQEKRNES